MFDEINKQLLEAQEGIARLGKIDSKLFDLTEQKAGLSKADELKKLLDKEEYDVRQIEKTSLASLFYSVLGTLPEHIEKEKKEFLEAKLKYDQAVLDLKNVYTEISKLTEERLCYADCQKKYEVLFKQKTEAISLRSGKTADQILKLSGT